MSVAKKAKRGRPPLPEGAGRTIMLHLKVTPAEAALVDSVAARHGINRSEVFRRAVAILNIYPNLMPPPVQWLRSPKPMKTEEDYLPAFMQKKDP
jgi:hypothetical protein